MLTYMMTSNVQRQQTERMNEQKADVNALKNGRFIQNAKIQEKNQMNKRRTYKSNRKCRQTAKMSKVILKFSVKQHENENRPKKRNDILYYMCIDGWVHFIYVYIFRSFVRSTVSIYSVMCVRT